MLCSMSRKGTGYDKAPVERFLAPLKKEWGHPRRYRSRAEAELFEYIEGG